MKNKNLGFSLIEIIVAIGLAAIFIPVIGSTLSFSIRSSSQGEKFSQAHRLAQEGMEAIFYLKSHGGSEWQWELNNPENTVLGEYYQPTQVGADWQLGGKIPEDSLTPEGIFTRKIAVAEVSRCGLRVCEEGEIGGIPDKHSRKITVYVTWPEENQTQEVKLNAYVTQH